MTINTLIQANKISKYKLSSISNIPYTTISDICSGKTKIEKSSAETVYKLAKALNVSMEDLVKDRIVKRTSFELYKSSICHEVKEKGDIRFLIDVIESGNIYKYWEMNWHPEALYLLAMVDYLSRINEIPLCSEFNELRGYKLEETIYPSSIIAISLASNNDEFRKKSYEQAIPEFRRFNIVENEVRNVC